MRPIDADALKEQMVVTLEALKKHFPPTEYEVNVIAAFATVGDMVNDAPTIDAVPVKHGKWVDVTTEEWCTFDECKCSVCGVVEYFNKGWKKFSYCPNCGAQMERSKE